MLKLNGTNKRPRLARSRDLWVFALTPREAWPNCFVRHIGALKRGLVTGCAFLFPRGNPMTDIKITLSQDDDIYAANPDTEGRFMSSHGVLYYPLHVMPRNAQVGCWVYFIFQDKLTARARSTAFISGNDLDLELYTYRDVKMDSAPAYLKCTEIERATKPISTTGGFQGFRYVKPTEKQAFEDAFN